MGKTKYQPDTKCAVPRCEITHEQQRLNRGWCRTHYQRWQKYGDPELTKLHRRTNPCSTDGCNTLEYHQGMCSACYMRSYRASHDVSRNIDPVKNRENARVFEIREGYLLSTHRNMQARCYRDTHPDYGNYGRRGITMDDRWRGKGGYRRFRDDILSEIGERPEGTYESGKSLWSINRIDNDGPYEIWNLEWADAETQNNNKRKRQAA